MEHGDTSIKPAEFETWLTPRAALALLAGSYPPNVAAPLIIKRIMDDEILAAARKMIFRHETQERTVHHTVVPKRLWRSGAADRPADPFWLVGDVIFPVGPGSAASHVSCVEVRFDREGVRRLLPEVVEPAALAPPKPRPPSRAPRIDYALLKAWYDQFAAGRPAQVYRLVQAAADAEFPNRRVPRALVRRAMGPGKRGNPAIRRS